MFSRDVVVLEGLGLFERAVEHLIQGVTQPRLRGSALHLGQFGDGRVDVAQQLLHRDAHLLQHRKDDALVVLQQCGHQVQRQHLRVAVLGGSALRRLERLLRLDCKFVPLDCHL